MNCQRLLAGAALAAVLCLAASDKPGRSKVRIQNPPEYKAFSQPLTIPQETFQAAGRLTFGARREDIDDVNRTGLRKWIDLQLNPEAVPENPTLTRKLLPLESIRMSAHDIFLHYPPPQLIAAIARGKQPLPDDPELREVVQHLIDRYLQRRRANGSAEAMEAGRDEQNPEPTTQLTQILSPREIACLQQGTPEDKRRVLASIPESRQMSFAYALSPVQRRQLLSWAPAPFERKLLLSLAPSQVVLEDLSSAKILRAVYSNHQLEEEMADFWFNHFNVFFEKGAERFLLPAYEREAIRPHVFGNFYDLLLATAQSPAMLFYLDNAESVSQNVAGQSGHRTIARRGLNENYGRELLELHTLGVDGGYTQRDVIEVARCFTGWTMTPPRQGSVFRFNPNVHDFGEKIVLGHVIPSGGGMEDGLTVLHILANAPQTAHHISLELAQRFVADDPPPSLVNRMSATYIRTGGNIRAVLKTMIFSAEFFSDGAYRAKMKTPFEVIVSAIRSSNAEVDSPIALAQQMARLGEPLYRKIEPTGYSSLNAEWISSAALLTRMNFALALTSNRLPGVRVDEASWDRLASNDPMNVARSLLLDGPDGPTSGAIRKALASHELRNQIAQSAELSAPALPSLVAGLAIGSPEFQRH